MQIEASVILSDCVGGCCFGDSGVGALVILGFGALGVSVG